MVAGKGLRMTDTASGAELPDPRAYIRLAAEVRREIADGMLRSGQPTPSITALTRRYGYARQTCAKALRLLEDESLITRVPGLGYYVL